MTGLSFVDYQDGIFSEIDHQAKRLACRHGLPAHELDEIRQDLITDLIARAHAYDDNRASPATFVALVAANRAALLGRRYYRQQCLFGRSPVSLDGADRRRRRRTGHPRRSRCRSRRLHGVDGAVQRSAPRN